MNSEATEEAASLPPTRSSSDEHAKQWFYATAENLPVGPVSFVELKSLLRSGTIHPDGFVIDNADDCEWQVLAVVLRRMRESRRNEVVAETKNQFRKIAFGLRACCEHTGEWLDEIKTAGRAEENRQAIAPTAKSRTTPKGASHDSSSVQEEEHKFSAPGRVAAGGLGCVGVCLGILGGIGGLVIGIALCCTGIGAIIGIPLIFFVGIGAMAAIGGGSFGMLSSVADNRRTLKGPCPYCGIEVMVNTKAVGVDCSACKKRIVIRDKVFIRVA